MTFTRKSHSFSSFCSLRPASLFAALLLPVLPSAATADQVTFDASGTFTVPAGVIQVTAQAWGAGGGGGGGANANMGGGGGGAYATRALSVTAGQQYTITVGAGGTGGSNVAGVVGAAGGSSTINLVGNPTILVNAVGGGASNSGTGGTGGAAASCVPVAGAYSGGNGAAAAGSNGGGGGAGAAATANGAAGSGITGGGSGAGKGGDHSSSATPGAIQHGAAPGGGGGGKDNGSFVSGSGAAGRIVLTYTVPAAPGTGGIPASQNYNERTTGQLRIAPAATITDTDSANFGGGYLDVTITTNLDSTEDKLYIATANNITLVNDQYYVNGAVNEDIEVYHGGTLIGTVSATKNGFRGNPLRIDLNANATVARVQDLLRSIYYQDVDVSNAVAGVRTLTITLNDGTGGSTTATTNVNVIAEPFNLNSDSSHWTIILEGDNYDPSEDQQAMSGPDLVGAAGKPLLYAKYDDRGTPDDQDDVISFRLRVDDSLNSSGLYNGYVFIGYDFELDGDIDCFISLEGTTKGTKTYVYEASGANASPSTTGIGTRYLIPNYNTLTMSNYSKVETIEGGTAAAANTYTGSDADPDYYQSFQINFKDLATVLNPLPINNYIDAGTGFTTISQILNIDLRTGLTEITPFRFIIATSTQPNAINSDFGGVGRLSRTEKLTTWEDLDVFEPGASFGNTAPIITTGNDETASYVIAENTTAVANVAAEDADADSLLYSILTGGSYGADGAKFRIDPATGALAFLSAPDYEAPTDAGLNNVYEVTIQVDDGKGGYDTQLVYVYVIDVAEGANARPVITSNGSAATATISVAENGTAVTTVTSTDGGDFAAGVVPATATYSISGGADAARFTINAGSGVLTFNAAPDYENPTDTGADNIYNVTVRVTDGGAPVYTDDQQLIITVTDVFEPVAPVLVADTPTLPTITEDDITNSGALVSAVLNGKATDANTGTVLGMAVTGQNSGNGTWQYSMDGGTRWIPLGTRAVDEVLEDDLGNVTVVTTYVSAGAVSATNALLLRAEDRIRFVPNQQNGTTATLNFRAWDESSGFAGDYVDASVTGGVTAFSNVSDLADITATDVNDAPTVSGGPFQIATVIDYRTTASVSAASILANGSLTYGDVDTGFVQGVAVTATSGAGTWQYSSDGTSWTNVGAVADNAALLLTPSWSVRYVTAATPVEGGETAQLTLRGWDQTGATTGQQGTKVNASSTGGTTPFSIATFAVRVTVNEDTSALAITSPTVNEASPYATFTVSGVAGQRAVLSLVNTTTTGIATIEYFNGASWVSYTGGSYVSLPVSGNLLVRVALAPEQDTAVDGGETFKLVATTTGDTPSTGGVATINDDGTGVVYKYANANTSTPLPSNDPAYPALDDDRPLVVSGDKVNEASPYAVFAVAGVEGQLVKLTLAAGSATLGADAGIQATLEYFDGTTWVDYTAGSFINIPQVGGALNGEAGTVLARVPVYQDILFEGDETLTLNASTTSGTSNTGTTTIADDGTGAIYKYPNDNTSTPLPPGDPDYPILDDDRLLFVTGTTVNEASPYALFSVDSVEGQLIKLTLGSTGVGAGHATLGTDTGAQANLEYFNGSNWMVYTAETFVAVPQVGPLLNGETGTLLVRLPVNQDTAYEGAETFMLTALSFSGIEVSGNSTIIDDGTGAIYKYASVNTSTPLPSNDPAYPALDDDRPLLVTGTIVNEASPYATFTVGGIEGQLVKLTLASGTATLGADTGLPVALEYYNGTDWIAYTPNSFINIPQTGGALNGEAASVLVRVPVIQDALNEGNETFTLNAATTSNTNHTGTMTIADDGTGVIFKYPGPGTPTPLPPGDPAYPALDDDRALQSICFYPPSSVSRYNPLTLVAAASSGLPVSFVLVSGPATVTGNALAFTGAGDVIVTAIQPGNASFKPAANVTQTIAVIDYYIPSSITDGWTVRYGGEDDLLVRRNSDGKALAMQVVGTQAVAIAATGCTTNISGDRDMFTAKLDAASGETLWSVIHAGTAGRNDEGAAVAIDDNGDVWSTGVVTNSSNNTDIYLAKYASADGSLLWERTFKGVNGTDDYGNDGIGGYENAAPYLGGDIRRCAIALAADGGVVITGYGTNASRVMDALTIKYDANGNLAWTGVYNGPANGYDYGHCVAIDGAGDVFIVGASWGTNPDAIVVKYAGATGVQQWAQRYDGGKPDAAIHMKLDSNGDPVIGGYSQRTTFDFLMARFDSVTGALSWLDVRDSRNSSDAAWDFALVDDRPIVTGTSYPQNSVFDGYTFRYNCDCSNDAIIWARPYNGPDSKQDQMLSMGVDMFGNPIVTGYSQNSNGTYDVQTVKYGAEDGAVLWQKRFNGAGNGNDWPRQVLVDPAGNVFIAGFSTNNEGTTDSWVTRYVATEPSTTAAQVITFLQPPTQGVTGTLHLAATASSGLPVEFGLVSGPAELNDGVLTFTGTGEVTVRATQPGDGTYLAAAAVERTFGVTTSRQIIWFSLPPETSAAVPLALEAIASSGLPVTLEVVDGPATIAGNLLSFTGTGTVSVRASQTGDSSYAAAPPVVRSVTAGGATQTLTFTLPTTAGAATPLPLNGTASSGLTVAYAVSGPATVDGNLLRFTGAGTVTVVASQAGSNVWQPARSVTRCVVVTKSSQTIAFTLPSSLPYTNTVTLSATASSGLPVTFGLVSGPGVISANGCLSFTAAGSVTVRATQAGSALFSAAPEVRRIIIAAAVKPVLDPIVLADASVGQTICQRVTAAHFPTKFTATGLPAGVILNATTGVLSGKPTAAKLVEGHAVPYEVTFTAANAAGTGLPVTVSWLVLPLPTEYVGTFNGLIDRSTSLSASGIESLAGLGGSISITTTCLGTFSGRVVLETKAYPVSGKLDTGVKITPTASVVIKRGTGIPDLTLAFSLGGNSGDLTGTIQDTSSVAQLRACRSPWNATTNPASRFEGTYTAALELGSEQAGDPVYPQGNGFGTLKITTAGLATWTGRLADGTSVSLSTTISARGEIPMFIVLYTPTVAATAGSVHGWLQTAVGEPNTLDGTVYWKKLPQASASTTRSYKTGFPAHALTIIGGKYVAPTTTVLSLPNGANNARLTFAEGGIATASLTQPTSGELSQVFTITSTNAVAMPLTATANPGVVKFALTASSGLMSGSFTLKDNDPTDSVAPITVLARTTTYLGVLVPRLGRGVGAFQLAELPSLEAGTTLTTSPVQSGQVILESSQSAAN